jgi:hypothetical protein
MCLQSCRSPNFENFNSNLKVLRQNDIWVQALWPSIEKTIRGKVVAPPNPNHGESYEVVFARGSSVHQKNSNFALTNLLFGLCRSVWIIDSLVTVPISKLQHAFLPPKCCESGTIPQLFILSLFSPWTCSWIHQRAWGASEEVRLADK